MTKADIINAVVENAEITKADANKAVNAIFDSITEAMANGDKVALAGFGTFSVKDRAARTGINPLTKQPMEIAASKAPAFKAAKALKDAVK